MAKIEPLQDIITQYASISKLNGNFEKIQEAIENTLSLDGSAPNAMLADIDMNHFRLKNVGAPEDPNDVARLMDVQELIEADGSDLAILATNIGAAMIGTASGATIQQKLSEKMSIFDFIPQNLINGVTLGTGTTDLSEYFQDAADASFGNGKTIELPAGTYKIDNPVYFYNEETDTERAFGVMMVGQGMGRTFIDASDFEGDEGSSIFTIANHPSVESGSVFLKGNVISDMTIEGNPALLHNGIKLQSCWYTCLHRLRIKYCGQDSNDDLTSGAALLIGAEPGDANPDLTSVSLLTILDCEFDENGIGILNIANNNANGVSIIDSSIRSNSRGGIQCNGSYWVVGPNTSIGFNGINDPANAFGGIQISEVDSSDYATGYRPKGVVLFGEYDTNYPRNIVVRRGEGVVIRDTTISFSDAYYSTVEWNALGITAFPEAQIEIGGTTSADRVYNLTIERGTRPSIVRANNLPTHANKHSFVWVRPFGLSTEIEDCCWNIDVGGWVAGTHYYLIREDSKSGTTDYTNFKFHTNYEWPRSSLSESQYQTAFAVQFKKLFNPRARADLDFGYILTDDEVISLPLPSRMSEFTGRSYGFVYVTGNGLEENTALIGYRAVATSAIYKLSGNTAANIQLLTGILDNTSGTDGKLVVSVHSDDKLYIRNRLGGTANIIISFGSIAGAPNQSI